VIVLLDAEAFNALAGPDSPRKQHVGRILRSAQRLGRPVLVPSLAELYRSRGHNQLVDACLARERRSLDSRDTDRQLARIVGGVLAAADAGSTMIVDAHVMALAVVSQRRGRTSLSVPLCFVSTLSLRDLRNNLGAVVREVAYTGHEAVITDNGREVAVIISLGDYERLHEHADVADALRLRDMRATGFTMMSLADMLDALGVSIEDFAEQAG
jgi:antitoxin YefM